MSGRPIVPLPKQRPPRSLAWVITIASGCSYKSSSSCAVPLSLPAGNDAHRARRHIRRAPGREVGKAGAAGAARLVAPRAIRRKPQDQVVEQDLGAVLHREAREPIGPCPLAHIAAEPDQDPGVIDKPVDGGHVLRRHFIWCTPLRAFYVFSNSRCQWDVIRYIGR
jgi:hypothetical protein